MEWFYDGQIRRYLTQTIRLLSNFSYKDGDGELHRVPVMYGDLTRQVASILKENSENKVPSAPRIAVYITGLEIDRDRTGDSSYVSKVHVRERAYDNENNEYLNKQGKNYTVERLMPTPFKLSLGVDLWSTNTEQKLQIFEQIAVLFNPSLEIQTTDNFVDWTSLTVVNLENIVFSSRTIPVGTESEIDILNFTFNTPIWLSPPAKVKRMGVITNIIMNIFDESNGTISLGLSVPELNRYDSSSAGRVDVNKNTITQSTVNIPGVDISEDIQMSLQYNTRSGKAVRIYAVDSGGNLPVQGAYWNSATNLWTMNLWSRTGLANPSSDDPSELDLILINSVDTDTVTETYNDANTVAVNYQQYNVHVNGNQARLINTASNRQNWLNVFQSHPGQYTAGVSKIFLNRTDLDISINGTITLTDADNSYVSVNWDTDTFPTNTDIAGKTYIDYVIDPTRFNPLLVKNSGTRFLILEDIGNTENIDGPDAWKNSDGSDFYASRDDIIEWSGTAWSTVFDSSTVETATYTTNLNTGIQYIWNGKEWTETINGLYPVGSWRVDLDG